MKRSPLSRRTPLKSGGSLKRTALVKKPPRREALDPNVRSFVLRRDKVCQAHPRGFALDVACSGRLHVHHRRLRSQGGTDHPDNLVAVCTTHHHHVHSVDRVGAERTGLIVRR